MKFLAKKIKNSLLFILREFFDLIYRQKCVICGCSKTNELLCKNCAKTIKFLSPFAQTKILGVQIYSAMPYDNNLKKIIRNLKYHHAKNNAKVLAQLLYEFYIKTELKNNFTDAVLAPVASHRLKILERGYAHTELIAKEFSKLSGHKVKTNIIYKCKYTKSQYKIGAKARYNNIKGSFKIKNYAGEKIIIIDDLITTGATLNTIIKEFQSRDDIICLTVCKA